MKLLICISLLFTSLISFCQGEYALGEKEFTQDKEEATVFTSYNEKSFPNLKDSIDLAYLMPPAGNQGSKGSCWAWATTYVLRSVMDNNTNYVTDNRLNLKTVYSVYSGETDHVIPWQTDQGFCWRTEVANAVEGLSKVVV